MDSHFGMEIRCRGIRAQVRVNLPVSLMFVRAEYGLRPHNLSGCILAKFLWSLLNFGPIELMLTPNY